MKIKLDENLPSTLASVLGTMGHDVESVPSEGLAGHSDNQVWSACQKENRFLITQDLDFSDSRRFVPGMHSGILLLRLGEPGLDRIIQRLTAIFNIENVEAWERCFVVVTDKKIRVLKPE